MPGTWEVLITFPDGRYQRRVLISDVLVQQFVGRPYAPEVSKDTLDQVTAMRIAELEIWGDH